MNLKIAIASSDGKNVDTHFGKAESFKIYKLENGKFIYDEERKSANDKTSSKGSCGSGNNCGHGGGNCGNSVESSNVALLSDCAAVVASRFGSQIIRQFERKAISIFDIECPVDFALEKLAAYYNKK